MFCSCPFEILIFKDGAFVFALSPSNFVTLLPVRLAIYGNRKLQSPASEGDVLMLLGELQPTKLNCLGHISRIISCVSGCLSLSPVMPLSIHFI